MLPTYCRLLPSRVAATTHHPIVLVLVQQLAVLGPPETSDPNTNWPCVGMAGGQAGQVPLKVGLVAKLCLLGSVYAAATQVVIAGERPIHCVPKGQGAKYGAARKTHTILLGGLASWLASACCPCPILR